MKINLKAAALSAGIVAAIFTFLIGLLASQFGWGVELVNLVGTFYIGFTPTVGGAFIGAIWSFIDWAIGVAIAVWLYNKFSKK